MSSGDALDLAEGRLAKGLAATPFLLLVMSMSLSWLLDGQSTGYKLGTLAWAVLAGVWVLWMTTVRPGPVPESGAAVVYVSVLLVLIAVLGVRSAWFAGFFGFIGYLHSWSLLPRRWRLAGVAATATAATTGYFRGLPDPTFAGISSFLLLIVVIVAMVALFSFVGDITSDKSTRRKQMVDQLAETNAKLEETMRENAGLQVQLLLQAREAGITDERQRMAREIHDTLAQGLAGIITQVQAASRAADDRAEWQRHLDNAASLARDSLAEARRSVHAVGPAELESARLPDALAEVTGKWEGINGVSVEWTTTGPVRRLHPEVEVTILRVAQEALANVGKHAAATRVGVTLSYMEDVVTLDVRDDGAGFDPGVRNGGFGMTSMRQRVTRLAGNLEIESEPGAGTAISATVPARAAR